MAAIYSSFSNSSGDLGELNTEYVGLLSFLNSKEIKKKVDFIPVLNAGLDKITSDILGLQKQIRLFHFSGHSGRSGLDFPGSELNSEYISHFFNTINSTGRLQCVFLNGCENEEIVRKLSRIPVVIGTRSKIEDNVARKFTQDFFTSLIKSENTYADAFENAAAASNLPPGRISKTRSEGGGDEVSVGKLNDYFMVTNDVSVSHHKFPFNPKKTSWTKYILFFFILSALIMGFLFRDKIFRNLKGYSCTEIRPIDVKKCNFVIGDFSTIPEMSDFTKWLYENIKEADIIKSYLNAINVDKFSNVIYKNGVSRDSLPSLCHYDFNMTGSVLKEGEGYVADFNIFPYGSGIDHSMKSFIYPVKSLQSLDTLITTLSDENKAAFVLYNMCISCALRKNMPELPGILMAMAEKYNTSHTTEAYQRMEADLAELNLHYADTATALHLLDNASQAVGNDFALMAIERKIDLLSNQKDSVGIYKAETELHEAYLKRINAPEEYHIQGKVNKYQSADSTVRTERANLVIQNNNGKLKSHKNLVKTDLKLLNNFNFSTTHLIQPTPHH